MACKSECRSSCRSSTEIPAFFDENSAHDETPSSPSETVSPIAEKVLKIPTRPMCLKRAWLAVKIRVLSQQFGIRGAVGDKSRAVQCNSARREYVVKVANCFEKNGETERVDRDVLDAVIQLHHVLTPKQCLATRDMSAAIDPGWWEC